MRADDKKPKATENSDEFMEAVFDDPAMKRLEQQVLATDPSPGEDRQEELTLEAAFMSEAGFQEGSTRNEDDDSNF